MMLTREDLDRTAQSCARAQEEAAVAFFDLKNGNAVAAEERLRSVTERLGAVLAGLMEAGATVPDLPAPEPVPLRLLDTPSTRGLLEALRTAKEWAEEVDRERGHVLPADIPLRPGESRGTAWADTLAELTERLRIEVEGPRGRE